MSPNYSPSRARKKPSAVMGAALAIGLMAYGIAAKRRGDHRPIGEEPSSRPASGRAKLDWWGFAKRLAADVSRKHLTFVAAAAAFNAFLAIPAALAIAVSLTLLVFEPGVVQRGVQSVQHVAPDYVLKLLSDSHSRKTLGIGLLLSLATELWTILSANRGMLTALALIYGAKRKLGFVEREIIVVVLAAVTVPSTLASLVLVAVLPAELDLLPLSSLAKATISAIRWPILIALFMIVLATIYRYAPNPAQQRWRWTSWGGIVAAILWTAGCAMFSLYVSAFLPSDQSYGAFGAVMLLLAWLDFTAFTVLLGAQINVELEQERQIA